MFAFFFFWFLNLFGIFFSCLRSSGKLSVGDTNKVGLRNTHTHTHKEDDGNSRNMPLYNKT